jgi:TP901 family phage tail tape measure protein
VAEPLKGLEVYLSSEKAVEGAKAFAASVESAAKAVERIGQVVDDVDALLDRMGAAARGAAPSVKKTGDESGAAGDKMRKGGQGADDFGRKLAGMGAVARTAGSQIAAMLGSIGGLLTLRSAISTITETEDRLRILQSVTDATAGQMDRLASAANSLSLGSRFSFGDSVQTLIGLTKAGASAEQAIASLPAVSNLARAGLLSLDQAGDTVIQTMAQFGLSIEQAARIGDVLVKAADSTTASVGSLADSLAKVGPVGREFGVSMETVTAAVAQLQQSGVEARIAGTGLQRIFQQLADPANGPEAAAAAVRGLGLSFRDINPRNFTQALDNMGRAGLTLKDAIALVGTEFGYLLTNLVRNREAIKQLDAALVSASGDAMKKAAATVGTLGDSIANLSNAAERFYREGGKSGLSRALSEIAVAGADALNVLSGDAEAIEKAGTAGKTAAAGVQLVGGAVAGIASYAAIRGLASLASGMKVAGGAARALATIISANPIVALGSAVVGAGFSFLKFGDHVDAAAARLKQFRVEADEAEGVARRFDELRLSVLDGSGASAEGLTQALRRELVELDQLQKKGVKEVPAERILGAIQQRAPEVVAQLREVNAEIARVFKDEGTFNPEQLSPQLRNRLIFLKEEIRDKLGLELKTVGDLSQGIVGTQAQIAGLAVDTSNAMRVVGETYDRVAGSAAASKTALEGAAKAAQSLRDGGTGTGSSATPERARTDAIEQFLQAKAAELRLAEQSDQQQQRAKLWQDAINASVAAGRDLRQEEALAIAQLSAGLDRIAGKKADDERAKAVARVADGLRDENALLMVQGAARDALQKRQETINALKAAGVEETSAEYQEILKLLGVYEGLVAAEEKLAKASRGEARMDRRHDEAVRSMDAEQRALQLTGQAREQYRRQIDAENLARQAGLAVGSQEFREFVQRRTAIDEQTEAVARAEQAWGQFGEAAGSALERTVFDMQSASDAAKALLDDLSRLAFRQMVTNPLQSGFSQLGVVFRGMFAGGGSPSPPPMTPASGRGEMVPRINGGVIPALGGTVIDEPTFLQRAGRTYSIAEGGSTTPEIVMRLGKDRKGNLGVVAADGGGSPHVTQVFPGVRSRADARAMRATASQRANAMMSVASRRGQRGVRPR